MNLAEIFNKRSLIKAANYILLLALAAKAVHVYATHHPSKDELLHIDGVVQQASLGGHGRSTYFLIESDGETVTCSSYYGMVWPGMERIAKGETVSVLAERNKLRKGQYVTGKAFWIWQLTTADETIVTYEEVHEMSKRREAGEKIYINYLLYFAFAFSLFAYIQKWPAKASGE